MLIKPATGGRIGQTAPAGGSPSTRLLARSFIHGMRSSREKLRNAGDWLFPAKTSAADRGNFGLFPAAFAMRCVIFSGNHPDYRSKRRFFDLYDKVSRTFRW